MPKGELTPSGIWNVLDTSDGAVIGTIQGGAGAHNTVASNDGRYVYLGGRDYNYLDVYDTTTGEVRGVGPLVDTVSPFTVNGSNTLAFTTATGFDGFQVSSITTGKVLFTVPVATSGRTGVGHVDGSIGEPPPEEVPPVEPIAASRSATNASIRHLSVSPRAFRALARGLSGRRGAAGHPPAIARYEDSQAATTSVSVLALGSAPVHSPHACAPAAVGGRRSCPGVKVAGFVRRDRAGWNRITLTGWIAARKLAPGTYRLVVVPAFAGRRGAASAASFRILA
jgi:hypothetical protein